MSLAFFSTTADFALWTLSQMRVQVYPFTSYSNPAPTPGCPELWREWIERCLLTTAVFHIIDIELPDAVVFLIENFQFPDETSRAEILAYVKAQHQDAQLGKRISTEYYRRVGRKHILNFYNENPVELASDELKPLLSFYWQQYFPDVELAHQERRLTEEWNQRLKDEDLKARQSNRCTAYAFHDQVIKYSFLADTIHLQTVFFT